MDTSVQSLATKEYVLLIFWLLYKTSSESLQELQPAERKRPKNIKLQHSFMMLRLIPSIRPVFGRMQRFMCSEYVLPASPYAPESKYEQVESNDQKTTYFSFI